MDALRNALLSELASRAISFLVSTCGSRLMPVPATVREREEERLMHRLRLLLLRSATIVEEAEGRRVTNRGVLRQLRVLSDAMVRGHYVLDTVRYDAGGGGHRREEEDGSKEVVPAFAFQIHPSQACPVPVVVGDHSHGRPGPQEGHLSPAAADGSQPGGHPRRRHGAGRVPDGLPARVVPPALQRPSVLGQVHVWPTRGEGPGS